MQITNQINKSNPEKPYFKREEPKNKLSIKEKKVWYCWCCYKSEVSVLYVRATSIPNVKSDVKIDDEIRVTYSCAIKKNLVINNFCSLI